MSYFRPSMIAHARSVKLMYHIHLGLHPIYTALMIYSRLEVRFPYISHNAFLILCHARTNGKGAKSVIPLLVLLRRIDSDRLSSDLGSSARASRLQSLRVPYLPLPLCKLRKNTAVFVMADTGDLVELFSCIARADPESQTEFSCKNRNHQHSLTVTHTVS